MDEQVEDDTCCGAEADREKSEREGEEESGNDGQEYGAGDGKRLNWPPRL